MASGSGSESEEFGEGPPEGPPEEVARSLRRRFLPLNDTNYTEKFYDSM